MSLSVQRLVADLVLVREIQGRVREVEEEEEEEAVVEGVTREGGGESKGRPEVHRGSIGSRPFCSYSASGRPESVHKLISGADRLRKRVEPNPSQVYISGTADSTFGQNPASP